MAENDTPQQRPVGERATSRAAAAAASLAPAASVELPPLSALRREALRRSIAAQGVLESVVVSAGPACAGKLADGRLRAELCAELAVECPRRERRFASEDEFLLYRLSVNVQRRQLAPAQLIRLGRALEPLERARAAERRKQAAGRPRGEKSLPVELPEERGETRERVAALVGMKPASYSRGAKVLSEGSPQLVAAFERGEESINGAWRRLQAEQARAERERIARELERRRPQLPGGRFEVAVLDPPWPYPEAMLPYPTLTLERIAALPVRELLSENACLWLWTTNCFLCDSERIARECWGLQPRGLLTWDKQRVGMGYPLRGQTEHCQLFGRGKPVFKGSAPSLLSARAREHSRKPDEFYALLERLCPGRKLELFARERRPGWQAWGAEPDRFPGRGEERAA